jgi:ribosomal protein L32
MAKGRKKIKKVSDKDPNKDVSEVSYEEILNNPESYSDNLEAQEDISWCPDCGEYTIHVDHVCSVCGYSKKGNIQDDEEVEESTDENIGHLLENREDDLMSELGYKQKNYDDENDDD